MSITSIIAFLSVLAAFNVPQPTINQIRDILIPPQIVTVGTTTQSVPAHITPVPVQTSPIVPNQPVQFGSVPPPPPPCDNTPTITVTPFNHDTQGKAHILSTPVVLNSSSFDPHGQMDTVWLAIKATSGCSDQWSVSVDGKNVSRRIGDPSNNYPQGSDDFFRATSANIQASDLGTYEALITAFQGTTTATTTFDVTVK